MYLHNEEYYQRELHVPNIGEASADGSLSDLEIVADGIPRLFLEEALGYELFSQLDSFVTDGVLDVGAPVIWSNLVNGVEYTKNGVLTKWKGLAYSLGAFKGSILATISYYTWLVERSSKTSGLGEVIGNGKGSIGVNPTQKQVSIWNDFVEMNQNQIYHRHPNVSYHNGIEFTDWLGNNSNQVSLIEFLKDNKTDYPDAKCRLYEVKNQFGI